MFFEEKDNLIILRVRLTPNSSSCVVKGIYSDADGQEYLKLNVVSVPEKGKANQELVRFLAKRLGTAKGNILIISGETDRYKKLSLPKHTEIIRALQEMGTTAKEGSIHDGTTY